MSDTLADHLREVWKWECRNDPCRLLDIIWYETRQELGRVIAATMEFIMERMTK